MRIGLGDELRPSARRWPPRRRRPRNAAAARPRGELDQSVGELGGIAALPSVHALPRVDGLLGALGVVDDRGVGVASGLRGEQLGAEEAWLNEHGADAERRDLGGQGLHEALDAELGRGVRGEELPARSGRRRGDRRQQPGALSAQHRKRGAGDVDGPEQRRLDPGTEVRGRISSKNPALKLPALLTTTSRRPNDPRPLGRPPWLRRVGDVEVDGQQVVVLPEGRGDRFRIPGRRDHRVAGRQSALTMSTPRPRPAPVTNQTFFSLMGVLFSGRGWPAWAHRHLAAALTTEAAASGRGAPARGVPARPPRGERTARRVEGMTEGNDHRELRGDVRAEIREFFSTRRARISPEQAGLPVYIGDRRRVPGLRRSQVASLAGISPEYMTKLERGNATGVSDSVIDGLATPCSSTRPSEPTCRTCCVLLPPLGRRAAGRQGNGSDPPPAYPRLDDPDTGVRAQRPPLHPGRERSRSRAVLPRSTPTRRDRPTTPDSSFWTRTPPSSSATRTRPPTTPLPPAGRGRPRPPRP